MNTLKQTSDMTGIGKDTILYYEKIGLIPPVMRNDIGYRIYNSEFVDMLNVIACLKKTGMSLENIKKYMQLDTSESRYNMLQDHQTTLEQQMIELQNIITIKLKKIKPAKKMEE
ncbi:MerR family transcriptional regulator [Paenibacillus sp. KACC 21273]|uniref:MerR family transcriptional regulator n=2 Tax=Paenibacillus TaxID=44249 RepID=UPI0023668F9D|nr:MerR family transcriptional regulator [Paenibacillus sp. KACC 21273]WDF52978.1 MerR family transcriptional regulator [Paenibacillus sp. KACC 21273]